MKPSELRKPRYYHTCPCCGANLDPGERCDCDEAANLIEYGKEDVA